MLDTLSGTLWVLKERTYWMNKLLRTWNIVRRRGMCVGGESMSSILILDTVG